MCDWKKWDESRHLTRNITQIIQLPPPSLDHASDLRSCQCPGLECFYSTPLPHPTMPPTPSQRPFLPTLPNTELFLLNFHCILSAPHILALYGFLNCFISPAKRPMPLGQGSAQGVSHQPLQTQLRPQRKNSGG